MSTWLMRARSVAACPAAVPLVPIVPKTSPERSFGTNGTIGTRGRHVAQPSPDPAADGPQGWREALLTLSPDYDPCPGFRSGAWVRVWANALDFIERHGAEAHGLNWTATELFGAHPTLGVARVDHCGALILAVAGRVLAIEADLIRYANGLIYRRSGVPGAAAPVWCFPRSCR